MSQTRYKIFVVVGDAARLAAKARELKEAKEAVLSMRLALPWRFFD